MKAIKHDLDALVASIQASGHSVFAPSAAHRWMRCHASIRDTLLAAAAKQLTLDDEDEGHDGGSSFFSVEGTAAHHLAEVWMKKGKRAARRLLGTTFTRDSIEIVFDDAMFTEVERYVDWCDDLDALRFGDRRDYRAVELRVTFGKIFPIPDQGGTCDHLFAEWLSDGRIRLTVTDLKYGKGVRVFAERNPQAMLYAVGAIGHLADVFGVDNIDIAEIVIRICQPRLDHFDVWTCGMDALDEFVCDVTDAAHAAWMTNNPRYAPDPKTCRFCPVRGSCRALVAEAQAMADQAFGAQPGENVQIIQAEIPTDRMTIAEKEEVLRWRPTFQSFFRRLQEDLFREAEGGAELEHFKITDGRNKRAWKSKSPQRTAEWLEFLGLDEDDIWVKTIVSPAQAELVARAKRVASKRAIGLEVTSTAGPRTLAPVIDPRSALAGSADVFEPVADVDEDLS
jgi:hypothetical protein